MKVRLQKSVRFQEPTLTNEQSKGEEWRELLPITEEEEEEDNLSENETENDEREEWIPATSKVTVIQRDAPPELEEVNLVNDDEVIVEAYVAKVKRNPNRDVGISFTRADSDSPLCIDHITTHGPFSYSDLEAGMIVSAINGKYMTWSSPEDAMAELEKDTTMTVTGEYAPEKYYCKEYTMILEANLEEFCGDYGVTFDRKGENQPLYVKDVKEDGPFADLLPGLKVIAIDGQFMAWESPEKAQEALISKQAGVKSITVEATTENVNTTLQHVAFEMQEESKEIMIAEVETYTKHCPCDLREGMTVIMLNGQVCSEASSIDELIRDADITWDIIAVDLRCKRVLVNQDTSAGERMLTYCGAGALGMVAAPLIAIDMCTHPLNNMLTKQNGIEEEPEDETAGTRQLLLNEEETATREAVDNNGGDETATRDAAVGEDEACDGETQAASTVVDAEPYDEIESESLNNGRITIVSQDANDEVTETTAEPESASKQGVSFWSWPSADQSVAEPTVAKSTNTANTSSQDSFADRSLAESTVAKSTNTASAQSQNSSAGRSLAESTISKSTNTAFLPSQDTSEPEQAVAPALALRSVPDFSEEAAESEKQNDTPSKDKSSKPFFNQQEEKRTSFEFKLDIGDIEEAPTTMHSYKIQKISNEDVGLKLAAGQYGGVYIAEMKSHCKFRGTGVKSGMRIAKINGIDCPTSMRVATSFINGVDGTLELATTFGARPKQTKKREIFFSGF